MVNLEALRADVKRWAERFAPYREDDNDWYRAAENIDGKDASELGDLFAELDRHLGAGQPVAADRAALVERMAEAAWDANDRAGRRFARAFPDQRSTYLRSSDAALAAVESAGWGPLPMPIRAILDAPEFTAEEERAMQDLSGPRAEPVAGTGETLYRLCDACLGVTWVVTAEDSETHIGCDVCCGEGYVPVAPPEPLSAEEISSIALTAWGASMHGHEISWSSIGGADRHRAEVIARAVLAALPARFAVPVEGA